jgi:hypothetical protein
MTLSLVLALSMALSLASFAPAARGQQQRRKPVADTGVLTPGAGQVLRITVTGGVGSDTITVRFGWKQFVGGNCTALTGGTVCRHSVASEGASAPLMLMPDEAASLDVPGSGAGVQVLVFSNDTNARVAAQVIDAQTGAVAAAWSLCGVN